MYDQDELATPVGVVSTGVVGVHDTWQIAKLHIQPDKHTPPDS